MHRRNAHDHLRDATREMACSQIHEALIPWLESVSLEGNTYRDAYLCLSHRLQDAAASFSGPIWTEGAGSFLHEMADDMQAWLQACKVLS